jgi:4-hydroxy-2-oxoheptanedioate aldolase
MSTPLVEKLQSGKTALGLYINSPDMFDLCGYLGLDWFMIDQMFTANDWGKTEVLMHTGEAAGITPVVRIQSNPWLGYDHRLAVDVSRALGLGLQCVLVSNSGMKEIEECVEVSKDWHRKALTIHPYSSFDDWGRVHDKTVEETFVIPQPETKQALDDIEAMIKMPGIKAVFIAMTDASRVITESHQPDFYDARLWEYVDRAVELGREHNVAIGANTSYAYSMQEIRKRVEHLQEHGVQMIMAQGANFLFQVAMTEFMRELEAVLT